MDRISRSNLYMGMAILVSKRGTCPRAQVGAVLVRDKRIISIGYNGAPAGQPHCLDMGCIMVDKGCVRAVHAEANVIAFAAKQGISTLDATMYVTLEPCINCAKLMINAGIKEVVILGKAGSYPRSAAGIAMLKEAGIGLVYIDNDLTVEVDYTC